ncbi:MAG TPA: hypothetical protein VES79_11120 [Solirubrobacteraceae bacterium]|nr:hypothetical protein [Solirubrobacteraceae bacterium]
MRRAVTAAAVAAAVLAAPAAAQAPVAVKDRRGDVRGALDVVRVAMERGVDGRLRGEVTMAEDWSTSDLRTASGPQGSICLQLYTRREAGAEPPDYLVCATPPASGDELAGRVLRDRANGRPRSVARATPSRPTARTLYLRFTQTSIGRPAFVSFASEAVTRAARCPKPLGCRDTAPDPPGTARLTLRENAPPG